MKVSIVQTRIHWMAPENNLSEAEKMMDAAPDSDLYILPETWDTGFVTHGTDLNNIQPERTLAWMRQMADRHQAAICGSVITEAEPAEHAGKTKKYCNRLFFVRPDGQTEWYDKRHLFGYGGEKTCFKEGNRRTVVTWKGWRLLLLVCYDLRFPVWSRWQDDYDAILIVANWPESRIGTWDILTKARAIENQCMVIACNRTGISPTETYVGRSAIIGPDGVPIASAEGTQQQCITADIVLHTVREYREKFPFLADRDCPVSTMADPRPALPQQRAPHEKEK